MPDAERPTSAAGAWRTGESLPRVLLPRVLPPAALLPARLIPDRDAFEPAGTIVGAAAFEGAAGGVNAVAFNAGVGTIGAETAGVEADFVEATGEEFFAAEPVGISLPAGREVLVGRFQPGGGTTCTKLPHFGHSRIWPMAASSKTLSRARQVVH